MFLRKCFRRKNGKRHAYWALVESYRTERGPRQRVVAYIGDVNGSMRKGVKRAAQGSSRTCQPDLLEKEEPTWIEVDPERVTVENARDFGGPWLALELSRAIGLTEFLQTSLPNGREDVPWRLSALALVAARLCEPSSELAIAEKLVDRTALAELLGVPAEKLNDDRLYRALDVLLPYKTALEAHLKERAGELFGLDYDLLLYDMTSTYFEGEAAANDEARRGHSRDKRPDCVQVCIALVVTRDGFPLGYEVFPGNTNDSKTTKKIVTTIESRYGKADRIWVMDRGMMSKENVAFLKQDGRRYIAGTAKATLKEFADQIAGGGWTPIRGGVETKLCPAPDGDEVFILCRSAARREKERAIVERFEKRMEEGLEKLVASCSRKRQDPIEIAQRVGRLRQANQRAARLFDVVIGGDEKSGATMTWTKSEQWREWLTLSQGTYLLRSNVTDWPADELWKAYIQLTDAEAAFRVHKTDLEIRPIHHRKKERVRAHIFVCFLAYVLWKTLGGRCRHAGLGDEPRQVFSEIAGIKVVDVVMPTKTGVVITKRCITRPTDHQAILLAKLGLSLPSRPQTSGV